MQNTNANNRLFNVKPAMPAMAMPFGMMPAFAN
jgi:hypothetical protein